MRYLGQTPLLGSSRSTSLLERVAYFHCLKPQGRKETLQADLVAELLVQWATLACRYVWHSHDEPKGPSAEVVQLLRVMLSFSLVAVVERQHHRLKARAQGRAMAQETEGLHQAGQVGQSVDLLLADQADELQVGQVDQAAHARF
jgi:hypothetical protein